MRFAWDARKADANAKKHAVTFEEASTVFADPLAIITDEPEHRERSVVIGYSTRSRILFAVFAQRNEDEVRIISARRATARERKHYEEGE